MTTDQITQSKIAELRWMMAKAESEPFKRLMARVTWLVEYIENRDGPDGVVILDVCDTVAMRDMILAALNALPGLLDEIERLTAENNQLRFERNDEQGEVERLKIQAEIDRRKIGALGLAATEWRNAYKATFARNDTEPERILADQAWRDAGMEIGG